MNKSVIILYGIALFLLGTVCGMLVIQNYGEYFTYYSETNNSINYNVKDEVNKIYNETVGVFKYNISNAHKELNNSQLILEGGVCWHWTDWYLQKALEKNLSGIKIDYWINDTVGHELGLIYDRDEYCIVDQTFEPECRRVIPS